MQKNIIMYCIYYIFNLVTYNHIGYGRGNLVLKEKTELCGKDGPT